jgi:uncharacterized membrane protein YccC
MMLTGLVVLLFSFEGAPPGEILEARGIATGLGSALALLAYLVWPTWEQARVRPALAKMIDTYRAYLKTLLHDDATLRLIERTKARTARTNAQASLERLRGEPRRDLALIAFAEGVFANANRFIRAGMALEAVLQDAKAIPEQARVVAFSDRIDASLLGIVESLRSGAPPPPENLREEERVLAAQLDAACSDDAERGIALAVNQALDRITDSVGTLVYMLRTPPKALD